MVVGVEGLLMFEGVIFLGIIGMSVGVAVDLIAYRGWDSSDSRGLAAGPDRQ